MSQRIKQFYKFAMLGVSGSGKTCYLASLSLGRGSLERELAVTKNPVVAGPKRKGQTPRNDPDFDALIRGDELISDAANKISEGELPAPTDLAALKEDVLAAIEYKVTAADLILKIRTVDYPGELIFPDAYKDEDSSALKVMKILQDFDGLMILTETPNPGRPDLPHKQFEEINKLTQAFTALTDQKQDELDHIPVTIVLTKWDQWPGYNRNVNISPVPEIESLLSKYPAIGNLFLSIYTALSDQAKSTLPSQSVGYFKGNSAMFVTAAFEVGEDDKPTRNGFAYGLIEPLIWLAERRDLLDAEKIEAEWKNDKKVQYLPWVSFGLARLAGNKLKRMPSRAINRSRISAIRGKAIIASIVSTAAIILISTTSLMTLQGVLLKRRISIAEKTINRPETTYPELVAVETSVSSIVPLRRFAIFPPRISLIDTTISSIRKKREELRARPFIEAKADPEKYAAAKAYVSDMPNGDYAKECSSFIMDYDRKEAESSNAKWLEELTQLAQTGINADNQGVMDDCLKRIAQGFPKPTYRNPEKQKNLDDLEKSLKLKIVALDATKEWTMFENDYKAKLGAYDISQASDLLRARKPRDDNWEQLVKNHGDASIAKIQSLKLEGLKNKDYETTAKSVEKASEGLKNLELDLREIKDDQKPRLDLAGLQQKAQQEFVSTLTEIKMEWDKYLYDQVREIKSITSCERYLADSPLKKRIADVEKYKRYLESFNQKQTVKLQYLVKWHEKANSGSRNIMAVRVDGELKADHQEYFACNPGGFTELLGNFPVNIDSYDDDILKINVRIVGKNGYSTYLFGDHDGGAGEKPVRVRELQNDYVPVILRVEGTDIQNEFWIKIAPESIPPEPTFAEYGE